MNPRVAQLAAVLVFGVGSIAVAQGDSPKRFVPAKHWSGPSILYLGVDNAARFDKRLGETLPGKIWMHPGTRRALRDLWPWLGELLSEPTAAVREVTGKTPWDLLGLLSGELALSVRSVTPGLVEALVAIELGPQKQEILEVLSRLRARAEDAEGAPFESLPFEGGEAKLWPVPWGQAVEGVLGTHLVIATTRDLWDDTVARFLGNADAGSPVPLVPEEIRKAVERPGREAIFALDLGTVRNLAMALVGQTGRAPEIGRFLRVSGLHRLTWLAGTAGVDDGGFRLAVHVALKAGGADVLEALSRGTGALATGKQALALMPANASEVYAFRIDPGEILRGLKKAMEEGMPQGRETFEQIESSIEQAIGVSPSEDLAALPAVELWGFKVPPPAGSLFDDEVLLFPPQAFAPYRELLLELADESNTAPERLETSGGVIECFDVGGASAREAIDAFIARGSLRPEEAMSLLLSLLGSSPATAELSEGWTAYSGSAQTMVRLVEIYAKGPKLTPESALGALAAAKLSGASYASVSNGERDLLSTYNTLVQLASQFRPLLAALRIDVAHLPPAEVFLSHVKPGFLSLTASPAGFTFEATRAPGISQTSLVAVAVASVVAGFLVPALMKGRGEAYKVQCANNMKQFHALMTAYSGKKGGNAFPYSPDGSLASLQLLCDEEDGLHPKLFVCPEGDETPAELNEDGKLVLKDENVSYEMLGRRIKITAVGVMLLYDKAPHHNGRNVIWTDGSLEFVSEPEFQALLEKERSQPAPQKAAEDGEAEASGGKKKVKAAKKTTAKKKPE